MAAGACGSSSADTTIALDATANADVLATDERGADEASADAIEDNPLSAESGGDGTVGRDGANQDAALSDQAPHDAGGQDTTMPDVVVADAAGTTIPMQVTFYGWADNSPPGNGIAYPANAYPATIHNAAGGTGTYADPITFATAPAEFSPGTRLYVPFIEKYVVMEDSCGQCTTDWTNSRSYHIDLWMNSNGTESTNALMACEGSWTRGQTNVEVNPPPTRTVTTTPLFDPATNACRTTP